MKFFATFRAMWENRFDPEVEREMTADLWYGAIKFSFIAAAALLLAGGCFLWTAQSPQTTATPTPTANDTVSAAKLTSVVELFSARSAAYDAKWRAASKVVDPANAAR